jgi:hypothetical protein
MPLAIKPMSLLILKISKIAKNALTYAHKLVKNAKTWQEMVLREIILK